MFFVDRSKSSSNMKDLVIVGTGEENSIDIGEPMAEWRYPREEAIKPNSNMLKAAASGWMELINAESGETLTDSVQVGTPVSLVIRLKQIGSMDTMVSTCTAHSGDDFYDLTNFLGKNFSDSLRFALVYFFLYNKISLYE